MDADLQKAIQSLELFPTRCALAPESQFSEIEFRHFIFKSHRIIFPVEKEQRVVRVLHIRHARRRALGEPITEEDETV